MASSGDEITYTFSGSKVTEDISGIDEIFIKRMDGAGGGLATDSGATGGSGGKITNATVDVSGDGTLELWVGEGGASATFGGFGRSRGGDTVGGSQAGSGGGSTELVVDSGFVAAADAGGGGYSVDFPDTGGSGGARGGDGGSGEDADGADAQGVGFGGDGGSTSSKAGEDGGQELGLASLTGRGSTTTGGGSGQNTNGEIVLAYDVPLKPLSLTADEDLSVIGPAIDLSWSNGTDVVNRVYRAPGSSPTFPDDFTEVGTAAAGEETFTDAPPDYETTYTYRVTAEAAAESDPSDPETIMTSSPGELVVTLTDTNSPVTIGDTLDIDVEIENVGDYRADETIDADLEPQ